MNRLLEPAWALLFLTSAVAGAQTPPAVMPPSGQPAAKSTASHVAQRTGRRANRWR
jgi:hypothetical protein